MGTGKTKTDIKRNGILDMKFKNGDRVKYIDDRKFGDNERNPLWNGKYGQIIGTVYKMHEGTMDVYVKWDNGEMNSYYDHNLDFYVKPILLPDELFEL